MTTLSDIRSCFEFVGRGRLHIDVSGMIDLPMDDAPSLCRDFIYEVLEKNRGKIRRALAFIRQARESVSDIEDLTYVLYVEAVLLTLRSDYRQAVTRQARCAEICRLTGDKRLESDALLHLASLYLKLGQPAIAKVYEKEAALVLPRNRRRP
jgi:tetratricopeptide (TPR) repeat protein